MNEYEEILLAKTPREKVSGFDVDANWEWLYPFQQHCVKTALKHGRYALFEGCGLGKTRQSGTWAMEVVKHTGKPVIILAPLSVVAQTVQELNRLGIECIEYCSELGEELKDTIYISNYEQLDNLPNHLFSGVVLDESSILKSFTGATKRALVEVFAITPFKLCCTATPSPNDLNEIGNHSEFLNVLDAQDMRAKWFVREEGMNNYRLKGHAKPDFYAWMRTWCMMFMKPNDIGFPMDGYSLPPINYSEEVIKTSNRATGKLFNEGHVNATSFHGEVRLTLVDRLDKVASIVNGSKESFIIWIEQNAEGDYLRKAIHGSIEVRGSDKPDQKKARLLGFGNDEFRVLITKGEIAGFGMNYQNCRNMIFANPSFSFETIYQCICREYRFGQKQEVNIWMISTDTMENVISKYKNKETQFYEMLEEMNIGVNGLQYGLLNDYDYKEVKTEDTWLMKGDTCKEIKRIDDNSVDLGIWSPPFSSLFTYSNYIHDMGNNVDHAAFFKQYAYLLKEIYRILKPGRLVCCHTKDLGVYKNSSGFTGMYDFTGEHTRAMLAAGFKLHSKITIWCDPVLEMQRTKTQRLLYKTLTTDSSYTGIGMAEYITIFRKWDGIEEDWEPVTNLTKANFPLSTWQKWASPVWMDIKRTDVLNGKEGTAMGDEKHIAPLQLEVINRLVNLWSNKGETVFTPFLGIGSEAYMAVKNGRKAIGCELKDSYFDVAVKNVRAAGTFKNQQQLFL